MPQEKTENRGSKIANTGSHRNHRSSILYSRSSRCLCGFVISLMLFIAMKILISDKLSQQGIELLRQEPNWQVDVKTDLTPALLVGEIGKYDGLLVRSNTQVTADVIKAAQKLKVIGRAGTGVDNIDLEAATTKGI